MMRARGGILVWFILGLVVGVAGFAAPRFAIDDGISRYSREVERRVAINSIKTARKAGGRSFDALLTTAYRVIDIYIATEPCDGSPNMFLPDGDYASRVQTYTIFGLRYNTFNMTCGGDSFTTAPREQVR